MVRSIPPQRFEQLIEVATHTFVARGYRLTQMSDVADELGVAKGTLYRYVVSKEALFDACVRYADGLEPLPEVDQLPLGAPAAGGTVATIRARLGAEVKALALLEALSSDAPGWTDDAGFERIVRDLFTRMHRNRRALKLVDRCAVDHAELAAVWFEQGRYGQVALLAAYLARRDERHAMRRVGDLDMAARMVLETLALWAIHMPWDPSPRPSDPRDVESAVADMLVHAYSKEARP